MRNPPEDEERQIAKMIETNINFAIEQKHIHEIIVDDVDAPIDSEDI